MKEKKLTQQGSQSICMFEMETPMAEHPREVKFVKLQTIAKAA